MTKTRTKKPDQSADLSHLAVGAALPPNDDVPSEDWTLEQHEALIAASNKIIETNEKTMTPAYWRLGRSLALVKQSEGEFIPSWPEWLKEHGISESKASKAKKIADPKDGLTLEQCMSLTIEEAMAKLKGEKGEAADNRKPAKITYGRIKGANSTLAKLIEDGALLNVHDRYRKQFLAELKAVIETAKAAIKTLAEADVPEPVDAAP